MNGFIDNLSKYNDIINTFIWTKVGVWILIATGILMTILTKGFQITHIRHWMKKTIGSVFDKKVKGHTADKASISQFQALCTALAATVGVGNIAGVAAAIMTGGPGAVFWMWVAAFKIPAFSNVVLSGALMTSSIAWDISDTFNGLMMIPNLIGVVSLSPLVMKLTQNYVERRLKGKEDVRPMLSHFKDIEEANIQKIKETGEE